MSAISENNAAMSNLSTASEYLTKANSLIYADNDNGITDIVLDNLSILISNISIVRGNINLLNSKISAEIERERQKGDTNDD
jgi:hypothetical protein